MIDSKGYFSTDLREKIDPEVYKILTLVSREGYGVTLVGGAVRDLLIKGKLSHDMDFELRHHFHFEDEDWLKSIHRLKRKILKAGFPVEKLNFGIFRVHLPKVELEFASPRLEKFKKAKVLGHSDFEVHLCSDLPFSKAWARRDFTLNAIGIELGPVGSDEEFKLVDPFGGVADLERRELSVCSEDFHKDPVRFLRAVRFQQRFQLKVSQSLESELSKMNLSLVSPYYFFSEGFKSPSFFAFYKTLFAWIKKYKTPIAEFIKDLEFLKNVESDEHLSNEYQVSFKLAKKGNISTEEVSLFEKHAGVKSGTIKAMADSLTCANLLAGKDDELKEVVQAREYSHDLIKKLTILKSLFKNFNKELVKLFSNEIKSSPWLISFLGMEDKGSFSELMKKVDMAERKYLLTWCQIEKVIDGNKDL